MLPRLVWLCSMVVAVLACRRSGSGIDPNAPLTVSGEVLVTLPSTSVLESEPNDAVDQAQFLAEVEPGGRYQVFGQLGEDDDARDAFWIVALERVRLRATLHGEGANASAWTLGVYDSVSSQFVASTTMRANESFELTAKGAHYLVLQSEGDAPSNYTLTLDVDLAVPIISDLESGERLPGHYLGELLVGEQVRIQGDLDSSADIDRVLVAFPEACRVRVTAEFEGGPGRHLDIALYEATHDVLEAEQVAHFHSPSPTIETGVLPIDGARLLGIEVFLGLGPGEEGMPYELTIRAVDRPRTSRVLATLGSSLAPLENEGSFLTTSGSYFGEPRHKVVPRTVVLDTSMGEAELTACLARRGCWVRRRVPGLGWKVGFTTDPGLDSRQERRVLQALCMTLAAHPAIEWACADRLYQPTRTPNDELFPEQWGLQSIRAPEAWDYTTGGSVVIAVLDTGTESHPDLEGRFVDGYDMVDDPERSLDGDGVDRNPEDSLRDLHGVNVAGIIGATTNNGQGIAGVLWNPSLIPVRVFGFFEDTDPPGIFAAGSWVADAIHYVTGRESSAHRMPARAAQVINMSFGQSSGPDAMITRAIERALETEVVIVASAGNEGRNVASYPAATSGVISVSAIDQHDRLASYSSYHETVVLSAPGGELGSEGVLTTTGFYVDDMFFPRYGNSAGTSIAAPHVSAVAGLILAVHPEASRQEVRSILTSTAADLGNPGRDPKHGFGKVDAHDAVRTATGEAANPILRSERTRVDLPPDRRFASIALFNDGDGLLLIGQPIVESSSEIPWLTAHPVVHHEDPVTAPADLRAILVEVDRSELSPGVHRGLIRLHTNGGDALIRVNAMVEAPRPAAEDLELFVAAVDFESGETVAQSSLKRTAKGGFALAGLTPGRYRFFAGTDDDGDRQIGGEADRLYGEGNGTVTLNATSRPSLTIAVTPEPTARRTVSLRIKKPRAGRPR